MFRRLRAHLANMRDYGTYLRLMKELATPIDFDVEYKNAVHNIFADPNKGRRRTQQIALDEFTTFLAQRRGITAVLKKYGYVGQEAKAKLESIYKHMLLNGGGWVNKTFVPAAAISNLDLLTLLLKIETEESEHANLTMAAVRFLRGDD